MLSRRTARARPYPIQEPQGTRAKHAKATSHGIHDGLSGCDGASGLALLCGLDPLVPVDLDAVGCQRLDTALDDLIHHPLVAVRLLKLGRSDPDLLLRGDVLARLRA